MLSQLDSDNHSVFLAVTAYLSLVFQNSLVMRVVPLSDLLIGVITLNAYPTSALSTLDMPEVTDYSSLQIYRYTV